jgi:oligosaccharide repeat unit polymerase
MKIFKTSFLNPLFLSISIWTIDLLGHLSFPSIYGQINFFTFFSVLIYLIFFFIGYLLGFLPKISAYKNEKLVPKNNSKFLIFILGAVLIYFFSKVLNDLGPENLIVYRALVNSSFTEKNDLFWLLRVFSIVFFFANIMFFISNGRQRIIWGFVAVITSLLGSGRNFLLIFLLTAIGIYFKESKNNILKIIFISLLSILVFFGLFVIIFDKSDSNTSIFESIFISISSYFLNPLHGFTQITNDFRNWGTSMLLSDGILDILGIKYNPVPPMPYTNPPAVTNVYTLLWPMYHDLGFMGFAFFGTLYGLIHNYLYRGYRMGSIYLSYFYLLSLYPLIMSIFHDVYISSIGLWIGAVIPLFFFKRINGAAEISQ